MGDKLEKSMVNKSLGLTWIGFEQSIDKDLPPRNR
jgi:hypothetical protein